MMSYQHFYQTMQTIIRKFYIIDYAVNYLIDLETANRYINEPYINPLIDDLFDIYLDGNIKSPVEWFTHDLIDNLLYKLINAENDMRIATDDYEFLVNIYNPLKNDDLHSAYLMAKSFLTTNQKKDIQQHYIKFNE